MYPEDNACRHFVNHRCNIDWITGQWMNPSGNNNGKRERCRCIVWYKNWPAVSRLYILPPWSMDLFIRVPFQLHGEHTVLQSFRRIALIVHIAISEPSEAFAGSAFPEYNIKATSKDWEWRNMLFLWKSYTKRGSNPHDRQRHRQSPTL